MTVERGMSRRWGDRRDRCGLSAEAHRLTCRICSSATGSRCTSRCAVVDPCGRRVAWSGRLLARRRIDRALAVDAVVGVHPDRSRQATGAVMGRQRPVGHLDRAGRPAGQFRSHPVDRPGNSGNHRAREPIVQIRAATMHPRPDRGVRGGDQHPGRLPTPHQPGPAWPPRRWPAGRELLAAPAQPGRPPRRRGGAPTELNLGSQRHNPHPGPDPPAMLRTLPDTTTRPSAWAGRRGCAACRGCVGRGPSGECEGGGFVGHSRGQRVEGVSRRGQRTGRVGVSARQTSRPPPTPLRDQRTPGLLRSGTRMPGCVAQLGCGQGHRGGVRPAGQRPSWGCPPASDGLPPPVPAGIQTGQQPVDVDPARRSARPGLPGPG